MTVEQAIDDLFKKALRQEKIVPVAQADIKEVVSQSPLKFILEIEVLPEVTIDEQYKKIKIDKTPVSVSVGEVDAALNDIQTRFTQFVNSEDPKYKAAM
jgi:FKBP-type peptidyl-prolyl cis-trans isomerase (trigger factor)